MNTTITPLAGLAERVARARESHGTAVARHMLIADLKRALERGDGSGLSAESCRELLAGCQVADMLWSDGEVSS